LGEEGNVSQNKPRAIDEKPWNDDLLGVRLWPQTSLVWSSKKLEKRNRFGEQDKTPNTYQFMLVSHIPTLQRVDHNESR